MITEQGHLNIELGNHLVEGQLEGKRRVLAQYLAHLTTNLYCNWEIIWGLQFEFLNRRIQQQVKLFHSNDNWRNLAEKVYHIVINWKNKTELDV